MAGRVSLGPAEAGRAGSSVMKRKVLVSHRLMQNFRVRVQTGVAGQRERLRTEGKRCQRLSYNEAFTK